MAGASKITPFGWFCVFVGGALAFYMMINYVGLYQWLAELQLRWGGEYDEKITLVITYLACSGMVALVGLPLRKRMKNATAAGKIVASPYALILQLIGIGFLVAGVIEYRKAHRATTLIQITAAQLESNQIPVSDWVEATGYPVQEAAADYESDGSKNQFVPICSNPDGPSGTELHLFVKAKDGTPIPGDSKQPGKYSGMLYKADLPGPVRVAYKKEGVISDNYYVLDLGATPASKLSSGKYEIYVGGGVALVGVIIGLVGRFTKRQGVIAIQQPAASPVIPPVPSPGTPGEG